MDEVKLEDMSTNDILFHIKKLEAEYEASKIRCVNEIDIMGSIEKKYEKANEILLKRLKK